MVAASIKNYFPSFCLGKDVPKEAYISVLLAMIVEDLCFENIFIVILIQRSLVKNYSRIWAQKAYENLAAVSNYFKKLKAYKFR